MFTDIVVHTWQTKDGHVPTLKERAIMRKSCGPYHWKPTVPGQGRGFYQSSRGLMVGDATFDLRLELANDHLSGRLHYTNGYYIDSFQDTSAVPIVARLPHGRGFLPGYTLGRGMCAAIEADIYADIEDAARAAHQVAERIAELNRESEDVEEDDAED